MPKDLDFKNPNLKIDAKNVEWTPLVRQSGFQAATGDFSLVDPSLQKMREQAGSKDKNEDKPDVAPLLWGFFLAIFAGSVIGFVVPSSSTKKGLLILCCIVALGAVGTQAVVGFPISRQTKEEMRRDTGKKNDLQLGFGEGEMMRTSLKLPFYVTLLFCVGATVTTLLEPVPRPRKKHTVEDEADSDNEPPEKQQDW